MNTLWKWFKNLFEVDEQIQWDLAASSYWFDGYTDFDIESMIGPRPKNKDVQVDENKL